MKCTSTAFTSILLVAFLFQLTFAQDNKPKSTKFGKIEDHFVEMTSYDQDPTAGAVSLYNSTNVFLESSPTSESGLRMVYNVHRRIKILSESAVGWGDVEIPYQAEDGFEHVGSIKGITHNLDASGKVIETKLEKKDIYDEDIDGIFKQKRFSLPNVKVGSVIEYSYRLTSESLVFIQTHYFQQSIPVHYSEFTLSQPKGFYYQPLFLGEYLNLKRETKAYSSGQFQGTAESMIAENIPALKEEAYTTTYRNFVSRLQYQLSSIDLPGYHKEFSRTWDMLNKDMLDAGSYKDYLKPGRAVEQALPLALAMAEEEEGKISAIIRYIRANTEWNGYQGRYPSKESRELLADKKGNGAAINLLLVSMLRAAGYEAYPVMISTRTHGVTQPIYPMLMQFNHVIARVITEEGDMFLDAINYTTAFDMLPFSDLNGNGFMISEKKGDWVPITPKYNGYTMINSTMKLEADGTAVGNVSIKDEGYHAATRRAEFIIRKEKDVDEFFKELIFEDMPEAEVVSTKLEDEMKVNMPFKANCEFSTPEFTQVAGEFIYFQPMMFEQMKENPFKLEKRSYPVDFGHPIKRQYMLNLELPDGYAVETLPEATRVILPDKTAQFTFQTMAMGNRIQLLTTYEFKRPVYQADSYLDIKAFYDLIIKKHAESIVLKKIQ